MRQFGLEGGFLRLAFVEGHFPIFPWLSFYLLGLWIGRGSREQQAERARTVFFTGLLVALPLGFAWLFGMAFTRSSTLHHLFPIMNSFYPSTTVTTCFLLALAAGLIWLVVGRGITPHERHPSVTLGRACLTLLFLHLPLFREAAPMVGLWQNLSAATSVSVILGFLALSAYATRVWQRNAYLGGAEWLLRLSDRFTSGTDYIGRRG